MNDTKKKRAEDAAQKALSRQRKHLLSLHHCLARSDVMRHHHDGLVQEISTSDDPAAFNNVKKVRFAAYISFWFAGLSGVIERYEQLRNKEAIPSCPEIDTLLTDKFKDILKPFRNSVSHCSDHDDPRTLQLFEHKNIVPEQATAIANAFHKYFHAHDSAEA